MNDRKYTRKRICLEKKTLCPVIRRSAFRMTLLICKNSVSGNVQKFFCGHRGTFITFKTASGLFEFGVLIKCSVCHDSGRFTTSIAVSCHAGNSSLSIQFGTDNLTRPDRLHFCHLDHEFRTRTFPHGKEHIYLCRNLRL